MQDVIPATAVMPTLYITRALLTSNNLEISAFAAGTLVNVNERMTTSATADLTVF